MPSKHTTSRRLCPICGMPVKRSDRKHCSPTCQAEAMKRRPQPPCDNCGKILNHPASQVAKSKHHFCDQRCHDQWRSIHFRSTNNPAYRTGKVAIPCTYCGAQLMKPQWQRRRSAGAFCNSVCYGLWQRGKFSGPASPTWKGGITEDRGPNWHRQSKAARQRDQHRCQICHSEKLVHAHHIVPFRTFGYVRDENDNYLQANELSNLITLCASCHQRVEHGCLALPYR